MKEIKDYNLAIKVYDLDILCAEKFISSDKDFLYSFIKNKEYLESILVRKLASLNDNKVRLSYNFYSFLWDIAINFGIYRFKTEFLKLIMRIYTENRTDFIPNAELERMKNYRLLTEDHKTTLALDNIYNSVIAKDYNSNIRGFSQKNYLDFMYKLRIPVIKHQNIENKHIFYDLLAVDFIKIINRNGVEYVVLAPYGQQYLRVTRKNKKYKASSFVYYIF